MTITKSQSQRLKSLSMLKQSVKKSLTDSIDGLDCFSYGHLIQRCSDLRLHRQGSQLHSRLSLFSIVPNNFLASKLISLYSRTNRLSRARKVFDQIPNPNTFSLNAMLIAYSLADSHTQALNLFAEKSKVSTMKADNFTATCVLKALAASFPDPRLVREVHCYVARHWFDSDVFVGNALCTAYSKCDELGLARVLFEKMPRRDIVSWNSMLAGYSQSGFYQECKDLFGEMLRSIELRPNEVSFLTVFQACGQSKDLQFGINVHRYLHENRIDIGSDMLLCNAIIAFYAKCGSLDYARELFDCVVERDSATYGSMISGYMAHGLYNEALNLFYTMPNPGLFTWNAVISGLVQNNQHECVLIMFRTMISRGFRPNSVTISSVLPTIANFAHLKGAKEVHCYAIRNNYSDNIYVSTAIIDGYAKSGFIGGVKSVFDHSKGKSLVLGTAIISAYASHGDTETSLRLFDEMVSNGIRPDEVTFTAALTACAHSGAVDKARKIFNSMLLRFEIEPKMEHYGCLVTVLSRAGRLSEAAKFVSEMPVEPNGKVWGALLNGAAEAGDVEMGRFVFDRLFEIEPENAGNYVVMANLYSKAGISEEADEIRERMNRIGLKKVAGGSWIETRDQSQVVYNN